MKQTLAKKTCQPVAQSQPGYSRQQESSTGLTGLHTGQIRENLLVFRRSKFADPIYVQN